MAPRAWVGSWSLPSTPGPPNAGPWHFRRPAPQICRPWQTVPRAWNCGHPRVLKGLVCAWPTGLGTTRSPHPGPLSCATRPAPQDPGHPNGAPRGPSTGVPRFPRPPLPMCHSEIGVSRPLTQAPRTHRGACASACSVVSCPPDRLSLEGDRRRDRLGGHEMPVPGSSAWVHRIWMMLKISNILEFSDAFTCRWALKIVLRSRKLSTTILPLTQLCDTQLKGLRQSGIQILSFP